MNQRTDTHVIIVVYNEGIESSNSYRSFADDGGFILLVVDNSTIKEIADANERFASTHRIGYLRLGKNEGLSKAYNQAIRHVKQTADPGSWLITMDQDTTVPAGYRDEVKKIIQTDDTSVVCCPKVVSDQGTISPLPLGMGFDRRNGSKDAIRFSAINSGLLWRLESFDMLMYDESIFLDMVDHDIFMQIHALHLSDRIRFMESTISQSFSGDAISTLPKDESRFRIYTKDLTRFCVKWNIPMKERFWILVRRSLKLGVQHRSLTFARIAIRSLIHKEA